MPYESGMDPIHDTRRRFDVRFHLLAIAFLVFDVELLFLFPWAVASRPAVVEAREQGLGPCSGGRGSNDSRNACPVPAPLSRLLTGIDAAVAGGLVESRHLVFGGAMTFLALLVLGFVYDWRKGVFQWWSSSVQPTVRVASVAIVELPENVAVTKLDELVSWCRKNSLWPMPFATACCGIELMAAGASRHDIARFGAEVFRFSPRQCDLMIVAGRVVMKMLPVLQRIWQQMPEPKWCISMGACCLDGRRLRHVLPWCKGSIASCRSTCTCPAVRPGPSSCFNRSSISRRRFNERARCSAASLMPRRGRNQSGRCRNNGESHAVPTFWQERALRLRVVPWNHDVWSRKGILGAYRQACAAEAERLIGASFDAGVNFLDTADVYSEGESEKLVGAALASLGRPREQIIVATKVFARMGTGPNQVGLSRGHIFDAVDASLRRLRLDYIDLYQIHAVDVVTPLEETVRALDALVHAGKVALRRLLQSAGLAGHEGAGLCRRARAGPFSKRADVLRAGKPRHRARGRAPGPGPGAGDPALEPVGGRLALGQVRSGEARAGRRPPQHVRLSAG